MTVRYASALHREEVVPILDGPQAQGDILILPIDPPSGVQWTPVPTQGLEVIRNDFTGHRHTLYAGSSAAGIAWAEKTEGVTLGYLEVPAGHRALLVHSEEHTPIGIAPGFYALHRKRQETVEPYHEPDFYDRAAQTRIRSYGNLAD